MSDAPAEVPTDIPAYAAGGLDRQTRLTLTVLVIGGLAAVLDTTVVTIALHDLVADLHSSVATVQWVTTAYLLALTAVIPAVGWAEARLGGRRLWVTALVVFLAGSLLCAAAWNPLSLIGFRMLQGFGAGVLMTQMMTLAMRYSRGRSMARVTSTMSLAIALGPILGPILGGALLNWADWRAIFLINLPLCGVGIISALRVLPDDRPGPGTPRHTLDGIGLALLAPGLAVTVYGLSRVGDSGVAGGATLTVGLVLAGLVLIGAFGVWATRRGDDALLRVGLFARRSVGSASLMMFLVGVLLYGSMFLLPLYWQLARGESVLGAAMLLIPQGIGSLVSKLFVARLIERIGAPMLSFVSFLLVAMATVPFALADEHTGRWWLAAVLFVRGIGMGTVMVPIVSGAYVGVEAELVSHASMQTRALQQLGGAFGVAVAAMLLQAFPGSSAADEFHWAFWIFSALAAAASCASFLLPDGRHTEDA